MLNCFHIYCCNVAVNFDLLSDPYLLRVIRAAHELSIASVAVYGTEDRFSMHRGKVPDCTVMPRFKAGFGALGMTCDKSIPR